MSPYQEFDRLARELQQMLQMRAPRRDVLAKLEALLPHARLIIEHWIGREAPSMPPQDKKEVTQEALYVLVASPSFFLHHDFSRAQASTKFVAVVRHKICNQMRSRRKRTVNPQEPPVAPEARLLDHIQCEQVKELIRQVQLRAVLHDLKKQRRHLWDILHKHLNVEKSGDTIEALKQAAYEFLVREIPAVIAQMNRGHLAKKSLTEEQKQIVCEACEELFTPMKRRGRRRISKPQPSPKELMEKIEPVLIEGVTEAYDDVFDDAWWEFLSWLEAKGKQVKPMGTIRQDSIFVSRAVDLLMDYEVGLKKGESPQAKQLLDEHLVEEGWLPFDDALVTLALTHLMNCLHEAGKVELRMGPILRDLKFNRPIFDLIYRRVLSRLSPKEKIWAEALYQWLRKHEPDSDERFEGLAKPLTEKEKFKALARRLGIEKERFYRFKDKFVRYFRQEYADFVAENLSDYIKAKVVLEAEY